MRRTTSLLAFAAFLQACATPPQPPPAEPAAPPPEKVTPAAVAAPVWKVDAGGLEKSYRSSMAQCVDGALKVCRERDYRIRSQQKTAEGVTIAAEGRMFEFTLAIARTPENRTRVVLRTGGRAAPEHRTEAIAVLNKLSDTLFEPRD